MYWNELVATQQPLPILHSLRGREEGTLQFVQTGSEFLAVHDLLPYGILTPRSNGSPSGLPLLQLEKQEDDFSVFVLPEDALSLRAIARGTGPKHVGQLEETFRRAGGVMHAFIDYSTTERLGLADFSVSRKSGDILVLPPAHFNERITDDDFQNNSLDAVSEEIKQELATWQNRAVSRLLQATMEGFEGGQAT